VEALGEVIRGVFLQTDGAQPAVAHRRECAAASSIGDEGTRSKRPLATGLQEQVANHRKRLGSKAPVVSVAEKASEGVR